MDGYINWQTINLTLSSCEYMYFLTIILSGLCRLHRLFLSNDEKWHIRMHLSSNSFECGKQNGLLEIEESSDLEMCNSLGHIIHSSFCYFSSWPLRLLSMNLWNLLGLRQNLWFSKWRKMSCLETQEHCQVSNRDVEHFQNGWISCQLLFEEEFDIAMQHHFVNFSFG